MFQYSDFPSDEYRARCKRAQELMERGNLNALLLTGIENIKYFAGFRKTLASRRDFFILPRDGPPMLIVFHRERNNAKEMSWLYSENVRFFGGGYLDEPPTKEEDAIEVVVETIEKLGIEDGNIGLESDSMGAPMKGDMSLADYEALKSRLSKARFVDGGEFVWKTRLIKSPREIECLQKACEMTCEAFRVAFESMREGMSELELAKRVYLAMIEKGRVDDPLRASVYIRSGPERYLTENPTPTSKKIMRGDIVSFDGGTSYKGYNADMIRIACIDPSRKQREMFEVSVKACEKSVEMLTPGTRIRDIVSSGLDVIKKAGYERNIKFTRLGHGLGLSVWEPPILDLSLPYGENVLQEGMVVAIEPAFYSDEGSFLHEDNVLVTAKGPVNLTPLDKKLQW